MAKNKNNEFVGLNGEKILVNLPNNQENCEPMKYICLKADLCVLLAISQNNAEITTNECETLISLAISEKFKIPLEHINFSRAMQKNIINVGIDEKQQVAYKLLMAEPVKTNTAKEIKASDSYINDIKAVIEAKKAKNEAVNYIALEAGIKANMPTALHQEIINAVIPKSENTPKVNQLDFTF